MPAGKAFACLKKVPSQTTLSEFKNNTQDPMVIVRKYNILSCCSYNGSGQIELEQTPETEDRTMQKWLKLVHKNNMDIVMDVCGRVVFFSHAFNNCTARMQEPR